MKIVKADWDTFADYVIYTVVKKRQPITLSIEEIRLAAHSHSVNVYQRWWWDPRGNRAHPQFGNFFHHIIDAKPNPEEGPVQSVTFRNKAKTPKTALMMFYWRAKFKARNPKRWEALGWDELGHYLSEELALKPDHQFQASTLSVGLATHSKNSPISRKEWWKHADKDPYIGQLRSKRLKLEPLEQHGDTVDSVRFSLEDSVPTAG